MKTVYFPVILVVNTAFSVMNFTNAISFGAGIFAIVCFGGGAVITQPGGVEHFPLYVKPFWLCGF